MARPRRYDAIVLDVMLPGLDGFETLPSAARRGVWTPVLMLTARDAVEDRVAGLDAGADDYLTKPFSFDELLARLRALARRGRRERPTVLEVGDLRLDPATRQAWRGETSSSCRPRSSRCSRCSCAARARCCRATSCSSGAWDIGYENRSNVVDVYVRYLREKIDRPFGVRLARDGARRRLPAAEATA